MLKFVATTSGIAVSAAVSGIAVAAFLASAAPQANAEPQTTPVEVSAKGAACSSHSWPYYDQDCRFDLRTSAKMPPTVRVIALH
jgi:hypothetical protein